MVSSSNEIVGPTTGGKSMLCSCFTPNSNNSAQDLEYVEDEPDLWFALSLRPPSPFADDSVCDFSSHSRIGSLKSRSMSPGQKTSSWRHTLYRFLKRNQIDQRFDNRSTKKYIEDERQADSFRSTVRTKHVYWMDDDQGRRNVSQRFLENLNTLVQAIVNKQEQENHFRTCQRTFDILDSLFDDEEIRQSYQRILHFARKRRKQRLINEQQITEQLISRHFLSSF